MTMWMVRAGGGDFLEQFRSRGIAGLCFDAGTTPLPDPPTDALVAARIAEHNPAGKPLALKVGAWQTLRFLTEVKLGDLVVTYDRDERLYLIGEVTSGYVFVDEPRIAHARQVKWTRKAPRDALSLDTKNGLGSISTFFLVRDDVAQELLTHAVPLQAPTAALPPPAEAPSPEAIAELQKQTVDQSEELIEDRIDRLDWEQMQDLVAGILRAMGYKARVSPAGPDRGYDIFASPDGLGLEDPRIFVEVKHRAGRMGSKEIRSFLGGRSPSDKCLYVSTGGFTKDARYEADRAVVPVRLLDLADLRALLLEHYERLAPETAALVPLRRIYWPI
jgi:restriction system protein